MADSNRSFCAVETLCDATSQFDFSEDMAWPQRHIILWLVVLDCFFIQFGMMKEIDYYDYMFQMV